MKKLAWTCAILLGTGAVAAITAVVAAGWTDTRTASGNVSVSLVPDLLYICEPVGAGANPCPSDDSGADELIFETEESLLPGGAIKTWDVRLRNISPEVSWDVSDLQVSWSESADPGEDCDATPILVTETLTGDDDHPSSSYPSFAIYSDGSSRRIHVSPGGHDDMRFYTYIAGNFPVECQGNAWDVVLLWTVEVH